VFDDWFVASTRRLAVELSIVHADFTSAALERCENAGLIWPFWVVFVEGIHVVLALPNDNGLHEEIGKWATARRSELVALKPDDLAARMLAESGARVLEVVTEMAGRMRNPQRASSEVLEALLQDLPSLQPLGELLRT
jgi:hypothetical protein